MRVVDLRERRRILVCAPGKARDLRLDYSKRVRLPTRNQRPFSELRYVAKNLPAIDNFQGFKRERYNRVQDPLFYYFSEFFSCL